MAAPPAPRSRRRLYSLQPGPVSPVFRYRYIFPAFFLFYISLSFLSDIGIIYTYNIQYMIFSVYYTDIKRVYTILFIYRRVRAACPPCPPLSRLASSHAPTQAQASRKRYIYSKGRDGERRECTPAARVTVQSPARAGVPLWPYMERRPLRRRAGRQRWQDGGNAHRRAPGAQKQCIITIICCFCYRKTIK